MISLAHHYVLAHHHVQVLYLETSVWFTKHLGHFWQLHQGNIKPIPLMPLTSYVMMNFTSTSAFRSHRAQPRKFKVQCYRTQKAAPGSKLKRCETVSEELQKARFNKRPWKWKVGYFHVQKQNLQNSVQSRPLRGWIVTTCLFKCKKKPHTGRNHSNPCLALNAILGDGPKAYSQCSKSPPCGVRVLEALCYSPALFGWQSCHQSGLSIMRF